MGMYDSFKTDKDLEKGGVILDYRAQGFRITAGRAGGANKMYEKALERISGPHKRALQTEKLDNTAARAILMEAYAEALVFNWEVIEDGLDADVEENWKTGIEGQNGETLPVNKENIWQTFKNLPGIFDDVKAQVEKDTLFLASIKEANAKN